MQAEALQWSKPLTELIGFVSLFLANGAIGFRYAAVRSRLTGWDPRKALHRPFYETAAYRAAVLGLIGTLVHVVLFVQQLPGLAERMHLSAGQVLTARPEISARCVLLGVALAGFALASTRRWSGWPVAAVGLIGAQLAVILSGKWQGLINPLHQLFASLWLGTLLILVLSGLATVLRDAPPNQRGAVAADMVNGFSPLALICGPLLVLTGVVTGLLHLRPISSLWSTPYGYALLVKLTFVALVFTLGAWNWRRQRPRLGTEEAASRIRRSSIAELSVATIVLIVTAVLVSLPSPRSASQRPPYPHVPAENIRRTRDRVCSQ